MTRAPSRSASAADPSDEPLSAISTSPAIPARSRNDFAFATQMEIVSASLRHGIRMVSSSGDADPSASGSQFNTSVMAVCRPGYVLGVAPAFPRLRRRVGQGNLHVEVNPQEKSYVEFMTD